MTNATNYQGPMGTQQYYADELAKFGVRVDSSTDLGTLSDLLESARSTARRRDELEKKHDLRARSRVDGGAAAGGDPVAFRAALVQRALDELGPDYKWKGRTNEEIAADLGNDEEDENELEADSDEPTEAPQPKRRAVSGKPREDSAEMQRRNARARTGAGFAMRRDALSSPSSPASTAPTREPVSKVDALERTRERNAAHAARPLSERFAFKR